MLCRVRACSGHARSRGVGAPIYSGPATERDPWKCEGARVSRSVLAIYRCALRPDLVGPFLLTVAVLHWRGFEAPWWPALLCDGFRRAKVAFSRISFVAVLQSSLAVDTWYYLVFVGPCFTLDNFFKVHLTKNTLGLPMCFLHI